ncbi:hypothetical protein E4U21_001766 [Claviceps maximensis]|nr:hypothetical protein E4U21_001766 [Claviceps maximensis]
MAHPGGESVFSPPGSRPGCHHCVLQPPPPRSLHKVCRPRHWHHPAISAPFLMPTEPQWLVQHFKNPYFNDSHRRLQRAMKEFTDEQHMLSEAQEREATGRPIGQDMIDLMSKKGILHMKLGPGKHLHGVNLLEGAVKGEHFDYFHDLIVVQESSRTMTSKMDTWPA